VEPASALGRRAESEVEKSKNNKKEI